MLVQTWSFQYSSNLFNSVHVFHLQCPTDISVSQCSFQVHFCLLSCSVTSTTFVFSLIQICFCPSITFLIHFFPCLFVLLPVVLGLVVDYLHFCIIRHCWSYNYTWVVDVPLQAGCRVITEGVTVFGEYC